MAEQYPSRSHVILYIKLLVLHSIISQATI